MHSKHRLVADVLGTITLSLLVLTGGLVLLTIKGSGLLHSSAKTQEQGRIVVRKPWRVEPVQVVAAKNKRNANIEVGKTFDDDDDWLEGSRLRSSTTPIRQSLQSQSKWFSAESPATADRQSLKHCILVLVRLLPNTSIGIEVRL